ncbi:hypothetical protein XENOCAPTIV_011807, partial [Xenoophorus captivus]
NVFGSLQVTFSELQVKTHPLKQSATDNKDEEVRIPKRLFLGMYRETLAVVHPPSLSVSTPSVFLMLDDHPANPHLPPTNNCHHVSVKSELLSPACSSICFGLGTVEHVHFESTVAAALLHVNVHALTAVKDELYLNKLCGFCMFC